MRPIETICLATDLSERAARAESRAGMLAGRLHGRVEPVHVISPLSLRALARLGDEEAAFLATRQDAMEQVARELAAGGGEVLPPRLLTGYVAEEIVRHAEASAAGLVVAGAHGGNFVEELFLGSTVDRLAHRLDCPLLVVKRPPIAPYRRVLVAVDFSPASREAMELALAVAPEADVMALHVFEAPFEGKVRFSSVPEKDVSQYVHLVGAEVEQQLRAFLAPWANALPRPLGVVLNGHVTTQLRRKVRDWEADLVVVGKHGQSPLERLLLGSTTEHILYEAACDVLVTGNPN